MTDPTKPNPSQRFQVFTHIERRGDAVIVLEQEIPLGESSLLSVGQIYCNYPVPVRGAGMLPVRVHLRGAESVADALDRFEQLMQENIQRDANEEMAKRQRMAQAQSLRDAASGMHLVADPKGRG
jgi:hypothetical protein